MTKRMLIDDTQPEETRVVIVDGNKVEDVEFESSCRKQLKGNIYTAKVIRVEPSLQAAFIDYGGNKHGFLAFGEIHPDYYNISQDMIDAVEREVDEIIERKKQYIKEREEQRERIRAEKKALYEAKLREAQERLALDEQAKNIENLSLEQDTDLSDKYIEPTNVEITPLSQSILLENENTNAQICENIDNCDTVIEEKTVKPKRKYTRRKKTVKEQQDETLEVNDTQVQENTNKEIKVFSAEITDSEPVVSEEINQDCSEFTSNRQTINDDDDVVADDDDETENDFELQRKLIKARKLYHYSTIQDVIKEGQTLLIQIVKEERGNKGAACTTYLSLAGRYCVLMPNRIKSGGVSRKITNAADRKRLKEIMNELPLSSDMSMIIRTAGEEKTKADIVRDYNYLIRTWNLIRHGALKNRVPSMIYEEGNLIKRALRDMFTKDIYEVIVDGNDAFKTAREFVKILSPSNLKKIKTRKSGEVPVFQRFQVESQLDKLHNPIVQLESGGYLVINPTEALVSIDVNSGRATKEKDIEETALKTNLEAADEIARQLKMRDLAGLIVIDFIDMDEAKNNQAVEKRMKEALKNDRARIQIAKMSCFGLLEVSRQRMHSSFMESNYQPCPYCHGQGVIRTTESGAMLILRAIEEEGTKNRSSKITVFVPTDTAIYLLNQKRQNLTSLENKYKMSIIISADNDLKIVSDYRIERIKATKNDEQIVDDAITTSYGHHNEETYELEAPDLSIEADSNDDTQNEYYSRRFRGRRSHYDRRRRNPHSENNIREKESPVILYNSHEDININSNETTAQDNKKEGKTAWWRKLIG